MSPRVSVVPTEAINVVAALIRVRVNITVNGFLRLSFLIHSLMPNTTRSIVIRSCYTFSFGRAVALYLKSYCLKQQMKIPQKSGRKILFRGIKSLRLSN